MAMISILLAASPTPPCTPSSNHPVSLHWDDRAQIFSPDCRTTLNVQPSGDEGAQVSLEVRGHTSLLFRVDRDAILHWGPDNQSLLVEDAQYSNHYRLLLFDPLSPLISPTTSLRLDMLLRNKVHTALTKDDNIAYYFPRFVAWPNPADLIVYVGLSTTRGANGPFTEHCFGYQVDPETLRVVNTLTADELKKRYSASCQTAP